MFVRSAALSKIALLEHVGVASLKTLRVGVAG